jgi:nitrous oxidase accessory protein NosD
MVYVKRIPDGIRCKTSGLLTGLALVLMCGMYGVAGAKTLCVNPGGTSGCMSTISAAVAAASPGDTVQVSQGTYKEQVTITKSLALIAAPGASPIIDAKGLSNGIFINGISKAPNIGVADVLISGFSVRNANFEGILVVSASDVTLVGNHVSGNNQSVDLSNGTCPGIPAFETNEGDDCGEGIHLMGVMSSSVVRNESDFNTGGLLITDETGPSSNNVISENDIHDNPFDCGITLASHGPATTVIPSATVSFGVFSNTISHNVSRHNGYEVPGAGAGVGLFAPFPGTTAANNVVIGNVLIDNGLPGVAMHNHAAAPPPAPPINLNGNVIVGNKFSGNGQDTADAATSGPTGINIFSLAPVTGTVIDQNVFTDESIGVAFNAPQGEVSAHLNDFHNKGTGVENLGTGSVNATENWWNCAAGPSGGGDCATATGPSVFVAPWLKAPFADEWVRIPFADQ